jgi:serine/threonine protein phosphatase PrpC
MNEQIPGLAMSRSFGDYIASTVGVVSDPEVTYFKVEFSKGFMVIASDGVWEFLSNERVCEIIQLCIQDCSFVTNQIMENIATNLIKVYTIIEFFLLGINKVLARRG